jgi:OmcA/MtrC family decaheme c-type cytochrome
MKKIIPMFLRCQRFFAISIFAIGLAACSGSDGSDGAPGPPGSPGPPPGVDIGNATEITAEITSVTIASAPVVEFTLTDGNGNAVKNLPADSAGFYIAKLIPGTDGNASSWQSYINIVDEPVSGSPGTETTIKAAVENGAVGTLEDNGDGSYRYTFSFDIDSVTDPVAVSYEPTLTHRFTLEVRGFAPVINPIYDFRPSDGAQSGIFTREIVKTASCNVCHESLKKHGDRRRDTRFCVACHTPGSTDASYGNTFDAKIFYHKVHRGAYLPSVENGDGSGDVFCVEHGGQQCFDDVHFPQDIRNCSNCHDENDPETPDAANWYKVPTAEACGSCHDDVNFETGENHVGGPRENIDCTFCHVPDKTATLGAFQKHRILTQEEAAQYSLNILDITFSVPGTAPVVTFSVTDPTDNDLPYDLEDNTDNRFGGLLFYMAWATTDYTNPGNVNSGASRTDLYDTGAFQATPVGNFTYTLALETVPAGTTGSGIVSFAGQVTSPVGDLPVAATHQFFGIDGNDLAAPVPRRLKVDLARCDGCHQQFGFHGNRNQNLQVCAMCHNSAAVRRNDADPMDFKHFIHRKHAVDDIRYPQRVSNCVACHTDDGFYPVTVDSGVLSTSTTRGADNTDPTDNNRISPNSATCSVCHSSASAQVHMELNGGNFDVCQAGDGTMRERVDATCPGTMTGAIVQEGCSTCHAKGRIADVAISHSLNLD